MARLRLALRDPGRFHDPASLTWDRYVALQARERERYLAERAAIPAAALDYRTVSPRFLDSYYKIARPLGLRPTPLSV